MVTSGVGAQASVMTTNTKSIVVGTKAEQELFDDYGRYNSTGGVEIPLVNGVVQTTIPLNYIDSATEIVNDKTLKNENIQVWKLVDNGFWSNSVHFDMVDVQLINRVGWDGTIKPPYPDELGWKDTIRCNQLEDVYVAVRPKAQPVSGFGVPESVRNWDPSQPVGGVGSFMGFTATSLVGSPIASDPNYNAAFGTVAPAPVNQSTPCSSLVTDYLLVGGTGATKHTCLDNEFTWTNGMLGWAEQDFMRPVAFHPFVMDVTVGSPTYGTWITPPGSATPGVQATPLAPTLLSVTSGATGNTLTWADNSTTEYQFTILRGTAALGPFTPLVVPALANATSYVDTTAVAGTAYWYQVQAVGAKMDVPSTSAAVAVTAPLAAPAAPVFSLIPVSVITRTSLQLNWTAPAAGTVTGYNVYQNGVLVPAANLVFGVGLNNVVVSGLTAGVTYQFAIQAKNGTASSAVTPTVTGTTIAPPNAPAAPTATLVTATGFTLNWVDVGAQGNAGGATSYDVYQNGVFLINVPGAGLFGTAQSLPITGLTNGTSYTYSVVAVVSANGVLPKVVSAASPLLNIMLSPGVTVNTALSTDTTLTVDWATITGATDYWVYVNGQPWNYVGPGYTPGSGNLVAAGPTQSTQLTGLAANTTYQLTLMWGTAAGNSAQSVASSATTLPAAPGTPTATANSTSVTLIGTAVAGATSYTFYDNGVAVVGATAIATPSVTLTTPAGSLHSYTMAYTTGALTSGQSAALSVLTPLLAPTAAAVTNSGLTLNWTAGGAGVTGYTVYQNGVALPAVAGTAVSRVITGLTAGTSYSYVVVATAGAVASAKSVVLPVVTPMAAPTIANTTTTSLTLNWSAVAGATGYVVYQNGVALPAVVGTATTRNITGLTAGVPYTYTVAYRTAAVPLSLPSAPVSVSPPPAALAAPVAFAISNSSATVSWAPLPGVTPNYYIVYNNGVEIARPAVGATSYVVTGLAASTSYNFTVAYNVNNGVTPVTAAASPILIVKTTAAPVAAPVAPAAPVLPTATLITTTGLTLNWTAVAGATGYTVYQNGVALPAVAGTAVTRAITGLTAGTAYTYTVAASNAGGASAQSPVLTVSTTAVAATQTGVAAPVPTASLITATSLTLNWPAVAGATSYVVFKNGVMQPLVAGPVTSYPVTGLLTKTSYNFRIAYRNAVNVLSAPSTILTVTTP
jgi:hypothetical protein